MGVAAGSDVTQGPNESDGSHGSRGRIVFGRPVADWIGLLARLLLGVVLIVAGALKVGKPIVSARAVQAHQIFPFEIAGYIGYALPVLEIAVGLLLVLGLFTRAAALIGALPPLVLALTIQRYLVQGLSFGAVKG